MADNRYNFVSPGAEAGDAIEELLLQREASKRQAMLDALNQKQTEAQIANAAGANTRADAEFEYNKGRDVTNDQFRNSQARTAAEERAAAAAAERAFRADEGERKRQSDADQKQRDRDLRIDLAKAAAAAGLSSRETNELLKRAQLERERDKLDTTRAEKSKAADATTQSRDELYSLAEGLMNDPQLSRSVGRMDSYMPDIRPEAKDFTNRQQRLKALLSLDSRGKLKGSGAISDFEARMLGESATSLDSATDEEIYKRELQRVMDAIKPNAGGSSTARQNRNLENAGRDSKSPDSSGGNREALRKKYGY